MSVNSKLLCVTGSGTDVGKTYAATVLLYLMKRRYERVAYYKPYQTACYTQEEKLVLPDVEFVKQYSNIPIRDIHTKYALKPALAPYHAAIESGQTLNIDNVMRDVEGLSEEYDRVVLEGAGGLYVPILKDYFFLDFFKTLDAEIALVSDIGLGTLNHTLLSVEALFRHRVRVKMILLSRTKDKNGDADEHNVRYLREALAPTPVLVLPHITESFFRRSPFPYEMFEDINKHL